MDAVSRWGKAQQIARSGRPTIEELYRRHAPEARRLAYLLVGNKEAAEDIAQDSFIRVIGRLGHLRDDNAFGAYLRRTVVNVARMQFRRKKVEARYLASEATSMQTAHSDADPAELDALRSSLARLPYRQRAAIVLRFYADQSDEEIGDVLGCAVGTVRSLVSRGLASIRADAEGDLDG